jgi:hypothetical protein
METACLRKSKIQYGQKLRKDDSHSWVWLSNKVGNLLTKMYLLEVKSIARHADQIRISTAYQ